MPEQNYMFNGKRIVVTYDDTKKSPQPTKIHFWYDDWFPSEVIARRRRGWFLTGVIIGCIVTHFIH